MAIETQQISAENVIETETRVFAHPDDLTKLDLLNITQPTDIDYLLSKVDSIESPIQDKGTFDASVGHFPSGAGSGWLYRVTTGGTIGFMELSIGDVIFAIGNVVDTADSTLWVKIDNTEGNDILRQSIIDVDVALTDNSNTYIPTQRAVKTYVDTKVSDLETTLLAQITDHAGATYITNISDWADIELDSIDNTKSTITINDAAESIIRIYIQGWGDIIDGWTHSAGGNIITFEGDINHVGKQCKVSYLVKLAQ